MLDSGSARRNSKAVLGARSSALGLGLRSALLGISSGQAQLGLDLGLGLAVCQDESQPAWPEASFRNLGTSRLGQA